MGMRKATKMMMLNRGNDKNEYEDEHEQYNHHRHNEKKYSNGMEWSDNSKYKEMRFDRECAEKWVAEMDKPDGSGKGGKWNYDQTSQLMKQKNIDLDPNVWFAVLNMLYSDYSKTLSKYNVNSVDAYVDLAKDWIEDDDVKAGDFKTAMYYHCIVK